jgi:hypothetical protein
MPETIAEAIAAALLRWRLSSRVRTKRRTPAQRRTTMNLAFLGGYRTYLIAAAMIVAGLGQLIGVEIPSFDGQSAGHLLMEGLAIIFLRKGMKGVGG